MVSGVLNVDSEEMAMRALEKANLTVLSLRRGFKLPDRQQFIARYLPSLVRIKRSDVINFTRDLATLLESGISLNASLDILERQTRKAAFREVLAAVRTDLETGNSLSVSFGRHEGVFSNFYVRMIRVGEEVGKLPEVLHQLVTHLEKHEAIQRKIKSGMTYPIFVLILAAVSVFVMVTFVLPNLSGLFKEFGSDMPMMGRIVMSVGDFFGANMKFILIGVALLVGVVVWYLRKPEGRERVSGWFLKIPMLGDVSLKNGLAQICRSMAVLIGSGVPLTEALSLTIETTGNPTLRNSLTAVHTEVNAGQSLSDAIAADPVFPVLVSQMVAVGESTGRLDTNLDSVADFYEADASRSTEGVLQWIGPIMIIGVGLVVGTVAITLFSSIYSASGMLK